MLYIDCHVCYGQKVWHYVNWEGEIITDICYSCRGSGQEEFECHDGCPPYEHYHTEPGEYILPSEVV